MGLEAYPFLRRVQVLSRRAIGKAVYREAFFEGSLLYIIRCGVGPARAAASIRNLVAAPSAVISVGIAGALVEDLPVGHAIVSSESVYGHSPSDVVSWSGSLVDSVADACSRENLPYRVARLATVDKPVFASEKRKELHLATGAHAVDMESHALGLEALKLGVPFTSLRVISDDVNAPPLPDRQMIKNWWRSPADLPRNLQALARWRFFLRDLYRAVETLHPVLVRLLREIRAKQ